jgi:hypothetical protein
VTIEEINSTIEFWSQWASNEQEPRYDIALFKISVCFEKFISELFVSYSIGEPSEKGYLPERLLEFKDQKQLEVFIRPPSKPYIDYPSQIKNLSKYIFKKNPFDVIFTSCNYSGSYQDIIAIRNYVAHESGEARQKLIDRLFNKRNEKFVEPSVFLKTKKKQLGVTHFTYYVNCIHEMSNLLVEEVS